MAIPRTTALTKVLASPKVCSPIGRPTTAGSQQGIILRLVIRGGGLARSRTSTCGGAPLAVAGNCADPSACGCPCCFSTMVDRTIGACRLSRGSVVGGNCGVCAALGRGRRGTVRSACSSSDGFPSDSANSAVIRSTSVTVSPGANKMATIINNHNGRIFENCGQTARVQQRPKSAVGPVIICAPTLRGKCFCSSALRSGGASCNDGRCAPGGCSGACDNDIPVCGTLCRDLGTPTI